MINKNLLYILPLTLLSCCQHKSENNLKIINEALEIKKISDDEIDEINLIIEAVLTHSTHDLLRSDENSDDLILDNLYRIKVVEDPSKSEDYLPPKESEIFYTELIGAKHKEHFLFTTEDSLYIIQQNYYPNKLKIADTILEKYNTEESINQKLKDNPDLYFSKLELSVPILSKDKQKAYIKTNFYCGALCGNGSTLYLMKVNNEWKVVEDIFTWIS